MRERSHITWSLFSTKFYSMVILHNHLLIPLSQPYFHSQKLLFALFVDLIKTLRCFTFRSTKYGKNLVKKIWLVKCVRLGLYIIKTTFATDCYFHMTIGLSITFYWHGTSAVEEQAQYHMSGCLVSLEELQTYLFLLWLCNSTLLMSYLVRSDYWTYYKIHFQNRGVLRITI